MRVVGGERNKTSFVSFRVMFAGGKKTLYKRNENTYYLVKIQILYIPALYSISFFLTLKYFCVVY